MCLFAVFEMNMLCPCNSQYIHVAIPVCVCVVCSAQECISVGQFYFVLHLLCTHPCYLCSWPHCWANLATLCVCECVWGHAHYGLNPNSLASSLPVWGGSGVALAASQGHVSLSKRCLCVHPRIIPTAHHPRLGLLRLPLVCPARSVRYVCSQRRTFKSWSSRNQFLDVGLILF